MIQILDMATGHIQCSEQETQTASDGSVMPREMPQTALQAIPIERVEAHPKRAPESWGIRNLDAFLDTQD